MLLVTILQGANAKQTITCLLKATVLNVHPLYLSAIQLGSQLHQSHLVIGDTILPVQILTVIHFLDALCQVALVETVPSIDANRVMMVHCVQHVLISMRFMEKNVLHVQVVKTIDLFHGKLLC